MGQPGATNTLTYQLHGVLHEFALTGDAVRLGRAEDSELVLPADTQGVSRRHATLVWEGGQWIVVDNNSTNGTFLNGRRITREPLANGDLLEVGVIRFTYHDLRPPSIEEDVQITDSGSAKGSIFMEPAEMERLLGGLVDSLPGAGAVCYGEVQFQRAREVEFRGEQTAGQDRDGRIGLNMFTQVGKALLSTADLNTMFERILELALKNVPAQRGVICLFDEATGRVKPSCFRSSSGESRKMRISRTVINATLQMRRALLVADAGVDSRFAEAASFKALAIQSAMCVPLICSGKILGLLYVDTANRLKPFDDVHLEVLTGLALFSAVALEQARLRDEVAREQKIRAKLSRYHSPAVVDQICSFATGGAAAGEMLAEERNVTVVFSDLSGFTAASEKLSPPDVVKMLNRMFTRLAAAVFSYGGTLDKFMGDGMLAFFGAPLHYPDHQERAVRAALMMQQSVAELNADVPPEQKILVRIGINSGPAVVGEMGSADRHDYTVIGDTVNLASRLESSVAKPGQVVLGPLMGEPLAHLFHLVKLSPVKVKGKELPVEPWLVMGARDEKRTASSTSLPHS